MSTSRQDSDRSDSGHSSTSFARGLFLGEIHGDMVFPYPRLSTDERTAVDTLIASFEAWAAVNHDPHEVEANRALPDGAFEELGAMGLLGLYVDPAYGGAGLSTTGYCKVFERIGAVDPTLAIMLGVHQSIGYKGIVLHGTDEQRARYLPDLVAGRKRAGFALTEPNAGSDAYHIETTATRQSDGSYLLSGEKRWIGNGSGDVLTTFARTPDGDHIALIVEGDMAGVEVGRRYDTMGLSANDLRHLVFNGVRVPAENVLGEPGEGFHIATGILNTGRLSLGSGAVGSARVLLDLAIEHVQERRQFGSPLADFDLVKEKIGWIVSYMYGLESMTYLTTGMVDAGVEDASLESAMIKVSGTEFIWYAANRVFQLGGGRSYMKDEPFEKILRDIRIFPIFEGANDVLRMYVALNGLDTLSEELADLQTLNLRDPIRSLGTVAGYVGGRLRRRVTPARLELAHPDLSTEADRCADQVRDLRNAGDHLLRKFGEDVKLRQGSLKRLAEATTDIYAQIATVSRVTDVLSSGSPSGGYGDELTIAQVFCRRAAGRVAHGLDTIDATDHEPFYELAEAAYARNGYSHTV